MVRTTSRFTGLGALLCPKPFILWGLTIPCFISIPGNKRNTSKVVGVAAPRLPWLNAGSQCLYNIEQYRRLGEKGLPEPPPTGKSLHFVCARALCPLPSRTQPQKRSAGFPFSLLAPGNFPFSLFGYGLSIFP